MKYDSLQQRTNQEIANTINKLNAANGIDSRISARDVAAVAAAYAITPTTPTTNSSTTVKEDATPAKKTYSLQPLGIRAAYDDTWKKGWFKKGEGNFFQNAGATIGDALTDLTTSIVNIPELLTDAFVTLASLNSEQQLLKSANSQAMANSVLGKSENNEGLYEEAIKQGQKTKEVGAEFVKKDLYDADKVTKKAINAPVKLFGGDINWDRMEANSVFDYKTDSLMQSSGQLVATAGMQAVGVPFWVTTGLMSFGGESENALQQGATLEEATLSGLITAAGEVLTEKISGGIKFGGKALDDVLTDALAKNISDKFARTALRLGLDMAGEGLEEVLSQDISTFGQWLTYQDEESLKELLWSEEAMDAKIEAFLGGAALGGTSGGFKTVKSNLANLKSGTQAAKDGSANSILEKARQITEAENKNNTGYAIFKNVKTAYEQLSQSLEKTNGEISTIRQKALLGELKQETTRAQLMPYIERSAEKIVQNAELVAKKYSEFGFKDANGKPITVTPEAILSGIDVNADRATYIKQLRNALTTNSVLSTLAVIDATGHIKMNTAKFAEATLKGENLADQSDLEYFVEYATEMEKATVGKALGIQDWNTISIDQFRNKVADFALRGKAQNQAKIDSIPTTNPEKNATLGADAQNISQNVAKPLDNEAGVRYAKPNKAKYISYQRIGKSQVENVRSKLKQLYSDIDSGVATEIAIEDGNTVYIVDSGKENGKINFGFRSKFVIADENLRKEYIRSTNDDAVSKGHVSDELSSKFRPEHDNSRGGDRRLEAGEELSADKGQSQNNEGRVSSDNGDRGRLTSDKKALPGDENSRSDKGKTTERKSMTVIESAAFAKENVPEYKELNADDQARIRRLIRQAKANGFTDKQTRAYARVSARSGIDIVFDKERLYRGNGKYADGLYSHKQNKIFINPEGSRSPARLLIHELTHALYNDRQSRVILDRGAKNLTEDQKKEIWNRYFPGAEYNENNIIFKDELSSHYTEALLDDDALLEKLCNDNPTLKDKILSFFKKAITGYSDEPNLSREAKKLYKRYKTLFDNFSERNQYNVATSINNENMHVTEGKESTNIRFAKPIDSYPYDMQTVIKEYLDSADSNLENFIDDALSETNEKRLEYMHRNFVNDIPQNILNEIKELVGFDVSKFGIRINGECIHHINRMHGEQGKHDHSMQNKKDIARIQYTISNADKAEYTVDSSNQIVMDHQYRNSDNTESHVISITKRINGTYYVVCAVPDSKSQTMHIKSAYISKKEATQEFDAINAPNRTSKTNLEIASKDSISQNSKKSTENPKKVSTNSGDRYALPDTESDTDFDISTKLSEGIPRKTGKSSLTVGELRKVIANNTKQKVYSKQDALSVVNKFSGISSLTQKNRTEVADAVWQILNESPDVQYRRDVAHDMAEFIVAKIIVDAKTENPDVIEAQERLDYLRTGIGRLSFSEGDISEIRHVLDKKGLKQILGRWGYKGKQDTRRIPMDVFVCDIARQMPSMEYLEDMNPVDAFLEIDALYRGAKAEAKDKWISTYWDMPDSEIPNMIKSIEDEIMRAYETEGTQSKFSKMIENKISYYSERAEYWKAEYDKLSGRNRLLGLLMSKAQKMKDLKLGTFANSTQYDSDIFKNSIEKLARIQYRGNLNVAGTREIISNLHKWYTSNDVKTGILGYVDDKNTGLYVQGVSDMLEALANGTLKKQSVFQEISDVVNKALSNTGKINEKYNQKQISKVPSKIANLVSKASEGKIDLSRKHIALNGDHIWHEYRNHSNIAKEIGKKQLPFSPQSMEEAISAIYDPDMIETVFADANNPTQRQSFAYVKKSADGHYIVVEAIGGKDNPNIVPVMILQFSESKWNDMMSSGKTLGEMFFENDKKKLDSLDIEFNKKNRVIVAQFASTEAIANTPHSPQFNNSISQSNQDVNIKADDLEKDFSKQELKMLYDVMSYFTNFVENWGKVYRRGKWIEAKPEAERYINTIHSNEDLKVGLFSKLAGTTYMQTFGDPMTVARRMDRYESGFYTEMLSELRDAAVDAQVAEMEMRTAYDEFIKKNKNYVEQSTVEKVTYRGVQIPKQHLISLYMTMKRNHSWAGVALSGFAITDIDGKRVRVGGIVSPDTKLSEAETKKLIKEQSSAIEALLTKTDKEYIAILEKAYNVDARNAKADRDRQRLGFTNATNDYYYPIRRANISKNVDTSDIAGELDRVSNSSFNKDTVRGAKQELFIEPADVVFNRHIHAVCQYAHLSPVVEAYNRLYNMDISGNNNKPVSVASESANTWSKGNKYFVKLISDIQGIPASSDEGMKALSFIRGSYAKFQLGANPKVWLTQLSSVFASSSMLDADSIARGMSISSKDIDEYCSLAKLRNYDNTAAMAQGVLDSRAKRTVSKISKFSDLLMSPIGKMDRFTVGRLFGACQAQVEKNGGAKIGTEANKVEAGKLLRCVILETQQNSIATERSAAMRSGNEIVRTLTMFTSDSMKVIGRVIDSIGEASTLRARLRTSTDADSKAKLQQQLKEANRKTRKSIGALCLTAVFMASIAQLFRWLYDKEQDEDESVAETMLVDAVGNLFGGLPLFKDAYAKIFEGYDVNNYSYSAINDLLDSALNLFSVAGSLLTNEGSAQERNLAIRNLSYSVGQMFGIPTRNVYNIFYGLTKRFNPETAYVIDNAFYKKNYQNDLYKAIEKDDAEMSSFIMSLLLGERMNENIDKSVFNELLTLSKNGQKVLPKTIPSSITIKGTEYQLSETEQAAVKNIYITAEKSLKVLFAKANYQKLSDEQKAEAIDFVYDTYYDKALANTLGIDRGNNHLIAEVVGADLLALLNIATKGLTSDTDKRGNVISGSKKKKVVAAVNALGVPAEQKLLLIASKGYSLTDAEKKRLLRYILNLKATKAQKEELAELCGFTVKNGKIITKTN